MNGHPIDPHVKAYHAKLDELENVNRQLQAVEPLVKKKAEIEEELAELRKEIGEATAK